MDNITLCFFLLAAIIGIILQRVKVPYQVGMALVGLGLAYLSQFLGFKPFSNLWIDILLPICIFQAAMHIKLRDIKPLLPLVLITSSISVLLSILIGGFVIYLLLKFDINIVILLSILLTISDPSSLSLMLRSLQMPKPLQTLLESENLLSATLAIILFQVLFGMLPSVSVVDPFGFIIQFLLGILGGILVGIILSLLASLLNARLKDTLLENILSVVLVFSTYLLAEKVLHLNGVVAVLAAGLIFNKDSGKIGHAGSEQSWDFLTFFAQAAIFFGVGSQVNISVLIQDLPWVLLIFLALVIARAISIYGFSWIDRSHSLLWRHSQFWSNSRGGISLLLILLLPSEMIADGHILAILYGVSLAFLLVEGITFRPLFKYMEIAFRNPMINEFEKQRARVIATQSAKEKLDKMTQQGIIIPANAEKIASRVEQQILANVTAYQNTLVNYPELAAEDLQNALRQAVYSEIASLDEMLSQGLLSVETHLELVTGLKENLADPEKVFPELVPVEKAG